MEENKKIENKINSNETKKISGSKPEISGKIKSDRKGVRIKTGVFLIAINIIILGFSFYLISVLPKKAAELNKAKSDEQKIIESNKVDVGGLEYAPTKEKVGKIMMYFPEEEGLIDFIEMLEDMKEKGMIKNFSLVGQNAVRDKTGAYGLPFIAEFEGTWEAIGVSLGELQELPYLIRSINIDARVIGEDVINLKYGGFLYVSDKLAKSR